MIAFVRTPSNWQRAKSWSPGRERRDEKKIHSSRLGYSWRPQPFTKNRRTDFREKIFSSTPSAESLNEPFDETPTSAPLNKRHSWWSSPYDGEILRFAGPLLLTNLLVPITTAVDTAVVGRLGSAQLSGVAVGSVPFNMISSCVSFIPILIAPFVARNYAANKNDEVSSFVAQAAWLALGLGVILGVFVFTQADFIARLLNPAESVQPFATAYLKAIATVYPATMGFSCCGGVLRGLKDSTSILKAAIVYGILNIILDFTFIFGFGWSVTGAAVATVLSLHIALGILTHKLILSGAFRIKDFLRGPNIGTILPLIKDGFQLSLRSILRIGMSSLGSVLMSRRGPVVHSAFEVFTLFAVFINMIGMSFEHSVQAMSASALGKNSLDEARGIICRAIQISFALTSALVAVLMVFSTRIAAIFTSDSATIAACANTGPQFLALLSISAVVAIVDGALLGASKVRLVSLSQGLGYSLAIVALLGFDHTGWLGISTAWSIIRIGMFFGGLITMPLLFSSKTSPYNFALLP